MIIKQGVAPTGRAVSAARPPMRPAAGLPARRQRYRRRQTTTTDANQQNNIGPLGGRVIFRRDSVERIPPPQCRYQLAAGVLTLTLTLTTALQNLINFLCAII